MILSFSLVTYLFNTFLPYFEIPHDKRIYMNFPRFEDEDRFSFRRILETETSDGMKIAFLLSCLVSLASALPTVETLLGKVIVNTVSPVEKALGRVLATPATTEEIELGDLRPRTEMEHRAWLISRQYEQKRKHLLMEYDREMKKTLESRKFHRKYIQKSGGAVDDKQMSQLDALMSQRQTEIQDEYQEKREALRLEREKSMESIENGTIYPGSGHQTYMERYHQIIQERDAFVDIDHITKDIARTIVPAVSDDDNSTEQSAVLLDTDMDSLSSQIVLKHVGSLAQYPIADIERLLPPRIANETLTNGSSYQVRVTRVPFFLLQCRRNWSGDSEQKEWAVVQARRSGNGDSRPFLVVVESIRRNITSVDE